MTEEKVRDALLDGLQGRQPDAVGGAARRLLVIAGAGSGKTEVMGRRVAWWVGVDQVPRDAIVAFTFTERAADEMKFRIRKYIQAITPEDEDATLGGMYVGTIHSYCLKLLRELRPAHYHNYDIVDDMARVSLIQGAYDHILGLRRLQAELGQGRQFGASRQDTIEDFLRAYDLLNEYCELDVQLPPGSPPTALGSDEADWCRNATLLTEVGESELAAAFAVSAARFYAYLRCRRFLDFSTSQSELVRLLESEAPLLEELRGRVTHVVVDEVQDVNPVQDRLVRALVGATGHLTAVGDHRQAIYAFRGGRVDIMARLTEELGTEADGEVIELTHNFRSSPRIIDLSNSWNRTIGVPGSMTSPDMEHGRPGRTDADPTHTAALTFASRQDEADWIARTIRGLVTTSGKGARHDTLDGERGLTLSDIAILVRSSTDARTYMVTLQRNGIPAVVRAGPDLFSQPEVLLMVGALAMAAGMGQFMGRAITTKIDRTLGCPPNPADVVDSSCALLRTEGVPLDEDVEDRLKLASALMDRRMSQGPVGKGEAAPLRNPALRDFLTRGPASLRRVFPQSIFHNLLGEAGVDAWDRVGDRASAAMFHLGQLSSLVTGVETRGWTSTREYRYQIQALVLWGARNARTEEAPLLVTPDAVQITTIHSAKGLEFATVFLADVCAQRFPSNQARRLPRLPFEGPITQRIRVQELVDNSNYDGERRLMYVALTRAERFLFVTTSKPSQFFAIPKSGAAFSGVSETLTGLGGVVNVNPNAVPANIEHRPSEVSREIRLVTSFSDLRYYLECPHDFYLRKVLGFTPTIDQAFGYGRGVHNLLREIHSDPKAWAELAPDRATLEQRLWELVGRGLFYLRHTVGEPADRMRGRAVEIVADYVETYADELSRLEFDPEREFETLIEEEEVLVSGAIDVVRLDEPPRVTIVDFKSGDPESDTRLTLDEEEMKLQVTMYGLAARRELEYEPERGLVRYLGEAGREVVVDLDDEALASARGVVAETARQIRNREFLSGPNRPPRRERYTIRCQECDFLQFCGMRPAKETRSRQSGVSRPGQRPA
jgi:DNA helicase-2/ATP-dependent DNA helicase PcrA